MTDILRGFTSLESSHWENQKNFIRDNIESYKLFEKLLGFQTIINNPIVREYHREHREIHKPAYLNISDEAITEQVNLSMFTHNIKHLFAAQRPLEQNNLQVYGCIIRPVLESIPKIFYLMSHPEDTRIVMLKEEYSMWKTIKDYESYENNVPILKPRHAITKFIETEGKKILGNNRIELTENFFQNFRHDHTSAWFNNQVYAHKSNIIKKYTYDVFSMSSHASIYRSKLPFEYNREQSERFMKILTDLSFFNLYLAVNSQHRILSKLGRLDEYVNFAMKIQQDLKQHFQLTHLYPDHPEYTKKLILKPY